MDFLPLHELSANLHASQNSAAIHSVAEAARSAHLPSQHGRSRHSSGRYDSGSHDSGKYDSSANIVSAPASLAAVQLPPVETAAFVSNKHEVNPAIALNLIQELHTSVIQWQAQQRQIVSAMRAIYAQGPMVDGWLQSSSPSAASSPQPQASQQPNSNNLPSDATILRHGDADALMKYVEALESHPPLELRHHHGQLSTGAEPVSKPINSNYTDPASAVSQSAAFNTQPDSRSQSERSQYWLCYLRDDGSIQSQHCPPEQTATVGRAIARFQKFKQLKSQQQAIEFKLQQAVNMLTDVRDRICEHTG